MIETLSSALPTGREALFFYIGGWGVFFFLTVVTRPAIDIATKIIMTLLWPILFFNMIISKQFRESLAVHDETNKDQ